jgi:hypothetical protein
MVDANEMVSRIFNNEKSSSLTRLKFESSAEQASANASEALHISSPAELLKDDVASEKIYRKIQLFLSN